MCLFFLVSFWSSLDKAKRVWLQDFEWFEGEEHWPSLSSSSSLFVVVCLWPDVKTSHQQTTETLWHSKNIVDAVGKSFTDCKHSKTGVLDRFTVIICFGQVHCDYLFWTGSLQKRLVIWSSATWRSTLTPTTRTSWATTTRSAGQETPECDSWSTMSTCEWPASVCVCVHGSWSGKFDFGLLLSRTELPGGVSSPWKVTKLLFKWFSSLCWNDRFLIVINESNNVKK